jgi:hypothetical protein
LTRIAKALRSKRSRLLFKIGIRLDLRTQLIALLVD